MTDLAIETSRLSRSFGRVRAVEELTLRIPRGIIFGFLGPNGAGKTTTIRLLLGLLAPSDGHARVLGCDVVREGRIVRRRTGVLMENPGHYERLSAWNNLEFHARLRGLASDQRRDRVRQLLTHFGLWERRDDPVGAFSRGMRQKLGVARAVLHRPELLFLDEPTVGLDPEAAVALRGDIARLKDEGATVFLTTHNLVEAERLCDLVGVVRKGKILAFGPPAGLLSGEPADDARSLEDAYLEIMQQPLSG